MRTKPIAIDSTMAEPKASMLLTIFIFFLFDHEGKFNYVFLINRDRTQSGSLHKKGDLNATSSLISLSVFPQFNLSLSVIKEKKNIFFCLNLIARFNSKRKFKLKSMLYFCHDFHFCQFVLFQRILVNSPHVTFTFFF